MHRRDRRRGLDATAFGTLLGSLPKIDESVKGGMLSGIVCFASLFAGLYGSPTMKLADTVKRGGLPAAQLVNPGRADIPSVLQHHVLRHLPAHDRAHPDPAGHGCGTVRRVGSVHKEAALCKSLKPRSRRCCGTRCTSIVYAGFLSMMGVFHRKRPDVRRHERQRVLAVRDEVRRDRSRRKRAVGRVGGLLREQGIEVPHRRQPDGVARRRGQGSELVHPHRSGRFGDAFRGSRAHRRRAAVRS